MSRKVLDQNSIYPTVQSLIGGEPDHRKTVDEVERTVAGNAIVVVGMKQNPFPKKARQLLDAAGLAYCYLEYGSYLSEWKRRGALKMWTGWQTFPMVFVKGQLVGGFSDLKKLVDSGEIKKILG